MSETQLAEVPCAHPRFGLCRSRRPRLPRPCPPSPSFLLVAYLTPSHPPSSSLLSSLPSKSVSPSLSGLFTTDLVPSPSPPSHWLLPSCRCRRPRRCVVFIFTLVVLASPSSSSRRIGCRSCRYLFLAIVPTLSGLLALTTVAVTPLLPVRLIVLASHFIPTLAPSFMRVLTDCFSSLPRIW